MDEKLKEISTKLAGLKRSLNICSGNLSLVEYDTLYGDIEELQYLLLVVCEGD